MEEAEEKEEGEKEEGRRRREIGGEFGREENDNYEKTFKLTSGHNLLQRKHAQISTELHVSTRFLEHHTRTQRRVLHRFRKPRFEKS